MKDNVILWEGELVEFEGAIAGSSGLYLRVNDGNAVEDNLQINLVAAQRGTPVNITVAIVDSLTTAVAGVHYNDLSGGAVTIPANESFGFVNFEVLDDNIEPDDAFVIAYAITGGDVPYSENYRVVEHAIQVVCPVEGFTGDYAVTSIGNPGPLGASTFGVDGSIVSLTALSDTRRTFTANYLQELGAFPRDFEIDFICENVIIAQTQDMALGCGGNDVNLVTGPSTNTGDYDPDDDSSFTVVILDNIDSDCGEGPVETSYRFDKQ
jgi:hypothetical protein